MSVNSFNASNPPLTTKGDLYGFSTVPARVPVGTNGQVLTADSTATNGVAWATAAGGTPPQLMSSITNWYSRPFGYASATDQTFQSERTFYLPIILGAYTYDRIAVFTGNGFPASSNTLRLGIYNNDAATNKPSTVLLDAGTITTTTSDTAYQITISQTITTAGLYWLAFNEQVAGITGLYRGYAAATAGVPNGLLGYQTSAIGNATGNDLPLIAFSQSSVTGAFATAGTLTNVNSNTKVPIVWVRKN